MNEIYDRTDVDGVIIGRGVRLVCTTPSMTKQAMKEECDINGIMKRFERTGLINHQAAREAYFADVSEVPDFASAIAQVNKAEAMFMSLPAKLRAKFNNSAVEYVNFCSDPANRDALVDLGLVDKPAPKPAPVEVIVTNPVTPPGGQP